MAMVAEIDNSRTILHKGLAIRSGIVLALVILGFCNTRHYPYSYLSNRNDWCCRSYGV